MQAWRQGGVSLMPPWRQGGVSLMPNQIRAGLVLLVLHFVTAQPNLNLTQLQVVVLLPSGVVH